MNARPSCPLFGAIIFCGIILSAPCQPQQPKNSAQTNSISATFPTVGKWLPLSPPTTELTTRYLTLYARKKFAPLYALMGQKLSLDQLKRLDGIIIQREQALFNARDKAARANLTQDAYLQREMDAIKARIVADLGAEIAGDVDEYIRTLPPRRFLGEVNLILVYQGDPLSPGQIERLCRLLKGEDIPTLMRKASENGLDPVIAEKEASYETIVANARIFLTPKQLTAVSGELELQLAQLRSQNEDIKYMRARH